MNEFVLVLLGINENIELKIKFKIFFKYLKIEKFFKYF